MNRKNFAFDKGNFIALFVGIVIILVGFVLMSGGASTADHYDPSIFDARHTKVAPIVTLVGFLFIIYAIVRKPHSANVEAEDDAEK